MFANVFVCAVAYHGALFANMPVCKQFVCVVTRGRDAGGRLGLRARPVAPHPPEGLTAQPCCWSLGGLTCAPARVCVAADWLPPLVATGPATCFTVEAYQPVKEDEAASRHIIAKVDQMDPWCNHDSINAGRKEEKTEGQHSPKQLRPSKIGRTQTSGEGTPKLTRTAKNAVLL